MSVSELECINHAGRLTRVRCSSCNDPICTSCMRESAVGMKCPTCAQLPRSALRIGRPKHYLAAGIGGFVLATLIGAALPFLRVGLFGVFLPALVGILIGTVVSRAARGLSSRVFMIVGAAVTVAGLVVGPLLVGVPVHLGGRMLLSLVIAGGAAAWRVSR